MMIQWYALYTRPRHEKKVEAALNEKQIECYLPVRKVLRQWSDRKKWVEEPLFRSYIFVHADRAGCYKAVQTNGIVRLVIFRGEPAIVRDEEIDIVRRVLNEKMDVEVNSDLFNIGDPVRVIYGPLIGIEGRIVNMRGDYRLILDVPSVRQSMLFSVRMNEIEKIIQ